MISLLSSLGWKSLALPAVLIVWRHQANIERILAGNENIFRFGRSS